MTLVAEEFIRRFCLHILPQGFTKIRHFGIHSTAAKKQMNLLFLEITNADRPILQVKKWTEIAI